MNLVLLLYAHGYCGFLAGACRPAALPVPHRLLYGPVRIAVVVASPAIQTHKAVSGPFWCGLTRQRTQQPESAKASCTQPSQWTTRESSQKPSARYARMPATTLGSPEARG